MIHPYHEITLFGESFFLLPQKAIFRPDKKQLILSDVHLGKATHFRKQGLPMPAQSHLKDLDTLQYLLKKWEPLSVLILGDLFHSNYNKEWLWFKALLMQHSETEFILIEGNHDILTTENYDSIANLVKLEILEEDNFIFSHEPKKNLTKLNFCGHIHPGLRIYGKARQSEKLPCFYRNTKHFILPAFGHLTGLFLMEEEEESFYYLVTGNRIVDHKISK